MSSPPEASSSAWEDDERVPVGSAPMRRIACSWSCGEISVSERSPTRI